ncbi:MAG: site-specific integrase [Desulfobulbaceae bacterium]|nr:site-specific integrase [Desulfobulbaceae bacterium]
MNAQKAAKIRAELLGNIQTGKRPQSLKEMRLMDIEREKAEKQAAEKEEKLNISLDTVAQEYLAGLNKSTQLANTSRYNNHIKPIFGNTPLREIDPLSLERFKRSLAKKGLAPKTIHHTLTIIRTIFRKAISWGYYSGTVPTNRVDFPKVNNKRLRFLTHDEASQLLNELAKRSPMTHDQVLIALHCGLRSGEVRGLKWRDLDFKSKVVHLPTTKGQESQQVYMTDPVKEMLLERIPEDAKPEDYVFPDTKGGLQFKISDTFPRTVEDLGFNEGLGPRDATYRVVFHTLRHTFCSWLAMQGTPLYTIQKLARHKSISMTERYSHLLPDQKQDAVRAMAEAFDQKRQHDNTEAREVGR